uniref:Uncharacterized protein n=1 Tax=Chromera velia CCMP2878 TaxID=1169474 RepID=A0A0G4FWP0_9ALVE|eukprot:Cvel_19021.t1-p1 / transcript=Cvel_19021.t1 / gene=Cvel_19021 / organism=Chromera_velia_CCMP2878 / gene_product=hypothetical protein / transcript_product=hypothetical protein / location=Cvel_scaffold1611:2830-5265(-) / protein_length=196 / sequence_SO=supercontig / SO=protein_coding / is_pseudo=false
MRTSRRSLRPVESVISLSAAADGLEKIGLSGVCGRAPGVSCLAPEPDSMLANNSGWSHKRHNKLALPRFETLRRRMNDEGLGHWSVAARSTNRPRLVVKRHWREVAKEDNETGGSGKKRTTKHEKTKASSKKANEKKGKIDKDKKKKDKKKAKRRQSFEYDAPSRKDDRSNDGPGGGNGGRGGDGPGSCPLPVYAL